MKIALITDTHFGVRNDNALLLNETCNFFRNIFFPYLEEHNIKTVIHLGDVVDRRKYINFNTANLLRKEFLEPLQERNIDTCIIAGNHDTYYKDTNEINALREVCTVNHRSYPNIQVYDSLPTEVWFDRESPMNILFVPWINTNKEFSEKAYSIIKESSAPIVMGHLEISGFEMFKGSVVSHGADRNVFSKFDTVYSGHFHHKSTDGHIFYLGTPVEFTWSDFDDPKGFHVFDTETRQIEFVRNPTKIFHKIIYDNGAPEDIDYSIYKDKFVKVIVKQKPNLYDFDRFIERIEKASPFEFQVLEDTLNLNLEEDSEIINEAESTISIVYSSIDKIDTDETVKQKVKNMMFDIYNEALAR